MRAPRIVLLIAVAIMPTLPWAPVPVGSEFRVDTYSPGNQSEPAVAVSDSGDIVVV